ncbi:MAG TPA: class I SAM-dependent methyltransferase [Bryobacteraceae bacterium]|nr:class I SAM-dependent methyltransferase [Bryobacteraceae bacterium]
MSTASQQSQAPSPALIFDTLNAYMRTEALRGALELDVFTAIAEGNHTAPSVATRIKASEKGTRVLCDSLTVMGFLTKQNNEYNLTPDAALFLNRNSPAYLGTVADFLGKINEDMGSFRDMAAVIRKGGTLISDEGTVSPDNPLWVNFARNMAPLMAMPSELIAKMIRADAAAPWKVLDIAAGHGLYGIAIARHNPNARIVAVDWAAVLDVAKENAQKAGVAARHSSIPGSAFEVEFGSGYDIVLLTNFLHHFDIATNESLLRKIHAAMAPGGRVVTAEFIPNEDRVSPPMDAMFAMMMLGGTAGGDAYTFSEYDQMFRNAGFARSEMHVLSPLPNRVIVSYK